MMRVYVIRMAALLFAAALGAAIHASIHNDPAAAPVLADMDIGFAQDMSAHHQQAVTMTDMLAPGATADVQKLAEQIRVTQLAEIGQMSGWLQLANAAPASAQPMAWMEASGGHREHAMGEAMAMPGMASPQELKRLQHSTGLANQILFLQLMIRHHQGGIDMASYAFQHTTNDTIRRTSGSMVAEQTQEIQLMTMLLNQHETNK